MCNPDLQRLLGCPCRSAYGDLIFPRDLEAADILQRPEERLVLGSVELYDCTDPRGRQWGHFSTLGDIRCEPCRLKGRYATHIKGSKTYYSIQEKDPNEEFNSTEGFVKPGITFIVTDKLEIMPSTTIVSMSVLNKVELVSVERRDHCEHHSGTKEAHFPYQEVVYEYVYYAI